MSAAIRERWSMIVLLALGSVATMMTATTVNVALPSISGAFGLGQEEAQWLSTAFLAASTGFLLLNNWAIAAIGMRVAFCAAMLAFIAGGLVGATAQEPTLLIAGRVMQGAGAGLIQPMAVLLIFTRFPEGARGLALGIYSLCVIFSPAFGPAVGGVLVDAFDWRVVFVATAPLAMLAIPLACVILPPRDLRAERVSADWIGVALAIAAIALAIQGLAHGRREGWEDGGTVARLWLSLGAVIAFVGWEAQHPSPALDLRLFRRWGFCIAGLVIFASGAAIYSSTFLAPLFVQIVQHYSPTAAGEALIPAGLAMAVCFPLAGRLSDRVDARLLLCGGLGLFGASMMMLAEVAANTGFVTVAVALAMGRAGIGLTMPPANAMAMRQATGLLAQAAPAATFLSQTGGALGVALASVLLEERTAFHFDALRPMLNEANAQVGQALASLQAELRASGVNASAADALAVRQLGGAAWATSQLLAFRDCFLVLGLGFLMLAPIAITLPGRAPARQIG
jgi:DHA2 family multidrug resistance protein